MIGVGQCCHRMGGASRRGVAWRSSSQNSKRHQHHGCHRSRWVGSTADDVGARAACARAAAVALHGAELADLCAGDTSARRRTGLVHAGRGVAARRRDAVRVRCARAGGRRRWRPVLGNARPVAGARAVAGAAIHGAAAALLGARRAGTVRHLAHGHAARRVAALRRRTVRRDAALRLGVGDRGYQREREKQRTYQRGGSAHGKWTRAIEACAFFGELRWQQSTQNRQQTRRWRRDVAKAAATKRNGPTRRRRSM